MSLVLDILAWAVLVAGGFFVVVSAVGLHRMPDVFTRMHAASVSDTLGVGFLTLGMLLQTDDWTVAVRLVIILVVLWVTGAVATHALARAALHDGERPLLAGSDGRLRPTDCATLYPDLGERLARPTISEQVEDALPLPVPPDARSGGTEADEAEPAGEREGPRWNS